MRQRASHTPSYHSFAKALKGNVHAGGTAAATAAAARGGGGGGGHGEKQSRERSRLAKIIDANAYDAALWDDTRARLCGEVRRLGLERNPIVLRDVETSRLPPCAEIIPGP